MTTHAINQAVGLSAVVLLSVGTIVDLRSGGVEPSLGQARAFDSNRAWTHLREMVSLGPRPAGSPALARTRDYIRSQLSAIDLAVAEQTFEASTPLGPITMINLRATLPGRRPERILLTGHYDTKRFSEFAFVGANDGGSSAAVLIELAQAVRSRPRDYTYEFVWFDGEEAVVDWVGLDNTYGSRHYVEQERQAGTLDSIAAMILVDMVGGHGLTIERELNSTAWLTDIVWSAADRLGLSQTFVTRSTSVSDDHLPFLAAGVPAIDLIGFNHYLAHWHQPTDDLNNVSADSLQAVGEVLVTALPEIERHLAAR